MHPLELFGGYNQRYYPRIFGEPLNIGGGGGGPSTPITLTIKDEGSVIASNVSTLSFIHEGGAIGNQFPHTVVVSVP